MDFYELSKNWNKILENKLPKLKGEWKFENYEMALSNFNKFAQLSIKHNHHARMILDYNILIITLYTYDSGGLSEKDFQLAHSFDLLF